MPLNNPFKLPFEGVLKDFGRPSKALFKAFERPLKGLVKAFQTGLYKTLKTFLKDLFNFDCGCARRRLGEEHSAGAGQIWQPSGP